MLDNTDYTQIQCTLRLIEVPLDNKRRPDVIIKTHLYNGDPAFERHCKLTDKIQDLTIINNDMFKGFNLEVVNQADNVIGITKDGSISPNIVSSFISKYNKGEDYSTIYVLYSSTLIIPYTKNGNELIINYKKEKYTANEVHTLLNEILDSIDLKGMPRKNAISLIHQKVIL